MTSNPEQQPEIIRAFENLTKKSAIAVCDDTEVPLPESKFVADHCLAKHIARTKESFAFIPDQEPWQTYGIFQSANQAWCHDKLPVLAICAFSFSPRPFQRETGIETDTADQFLADLKLAHRKAPKLGESPEYVVRHPHNPSNMRDMVLLPANANLVVYQPSALSPSQLATIFNHVADVNGKVILCDNRSDFDVSHQQLSAAVEKSVATAVPEQFRTVLDRNSRHREIPADFLPNEAIAQKPHLSVVSHSNDSSLADPPAMTTKYSIYHAKNPNDVTWPDNFEPVARIDAENIYQALSKSQNFGAPWTENPGVEVISRAKLRSTGPGDVIVHNDVAQRFDGFDFKPIDLTPRTFIKHSEEVPPTIDAPKADDSSLEPRRQKIKV